MSVAGGSPGAAGRDRLLGRPGTFSSRGSPPSGYQRNAGASGFDVEVKKFLFTVLAKANIVGEEAVP
jgi:hypothetical protein